MEKTMLHNKLINKEQYYALSPKKQEEYVSVAIRLLLKEYFKTGLTAKDIENMTYFHRNTISKHLKGLLSTREIYVHDDKKQGTMYHINGNVEHPVSVKDIFDEKNNKHYSISLLENKYSKFVYIQELEKNAYFKEIVSGGILVSPTMLDLLIDNLQKIREETKNSQECDA
jgi:hypothetical protein